MSNEKLDQLESVARECIEILASQAEDKEDIAYLTAHIKRAKEIVGCPEDDNLIEFLTQRAASVEAQPVYQWRRRSKAGTQDPWHDAPKEAAYERVDEYYEARTLYTAPPAQPAPAATSAPEGWKLVPLEPTPGMVASAMIGAVFDPKLAGMFVSGLTSNYRKMLAAAPAPDSSEQKP